MRGIAIAPRSHPTTVPGIPAARETTVPMRWTVSPADVSSCGGALRVAGANDEDHADPAIEYPMHFGVGDIARALQPVEDRRVAAMTPSSMRAARCSGNIRCVFSTSPPPVMCAMPLTSTLRRSASTGFT